MRYRERGRDGERHDEGKGREERKERKGREEGREGTEIWLTVKSSSCSEKGGESFPVRCEARRVTINRCSRGDIFVTVPSGVTVALKYHSNIY